MSDCSDHHSPAHDLVREQDPAHLRIFVLSLVDDGLEEEEEINERDFTIFLPWPNFSNSFVVRPYVRSLYGLV